MITKDGYRIIIYTGILLVVFAVSAGLSHSSALWIATAVLAVVFIFHFFFFRNPQREIPAGDHLILSPADGVIIKIDEMNEPLYFKDKMRRVSIFMSIYDAHINRIPFSGTVELVEYKKGKFEAAFADSAAINNEQNAIAIRSDKGRLLFTQIAGLIARRIVSRVKPGDQVTAGERFGMIKYSSRVDLFLPKDVILHVKLKQKVKAGSTILGEFKS